ncbi:MAG: hypothetical protein LBF41_01890 [Deltaproteobacteria bacterium]|nr:hypothetical protein [Deltaproteobacteria bacterium]
MTAFPSKKPKPAVSPRVGQSAPGDADAASGGTPETVPPDFFSPAFPRAVLFLFVFAGLLLFAAPGFAKPEITELFLKLPDAETNKLTFEQRRDLLERQSLTEGYTAPSKEGYWVRVLPPDVITLFGVHHSPVTYKLFSGNPGHPDILVICRSRQTSGPARADDKLPDPPAMDLVLYRCGTADGPTKVPTGEYVPPVSVLDFVTADAAKDARARETLKILNETFVACLTCHASAEDKAALDIVTVTSITARACGGFLPQFKLIPLSWNGELFTKPYDRAADPDEPRPRPAPSPRGIYANPPPP